MPSTYAHFRFGKDVFSELSRERAEVITRYRELYDIGLHGPDIFFYYDPLRKNAVQQLGNQLHEQSGREVFGRFAGVFENAKGNTDAKQAYLYGFLCHFALDSVCHRYVNQAAAEKRISHVGIESEFERSLMEIDGLEPLSQKLTGHIHPTLVNASVISRFFDTVDAATVQKALRSMLFFHALLYAPGNCGGILKRGTLLTGMRLIGQYHTFSGLMIPAHHNPKCEESNIRLGELYNTAVPLAVRLIEGFHLETPAVFLSDKAFDRNFESELPHGLGDL